MTIVLAVGIAINTPILLALNASPGEKKIKHEIPSLYGVEANLNVYDADFAREQTKVFEADREKAHRVTLAEWKHRPLSEKIVEHAAGLFRSQL